MMFKINNNDKTKATTITANDLNILLFRIIIHKK